MCFKEGTAKLFYLCGIRTVSTRNYQIVDLESVLIFSFELLKCFGRFTYPDRVS